MSSRFAQIFREEETEYELQKLLAHRILLPVELLFLVEMVTPSLQSNLQLATRALRILSEDQDLHLPAVQYDNRNEPIQDRLRTAWQKALSAGRFASHLDLVNLDSHLVCGQVRLLAADI